MTDSMVSGEMPRFTRWPQGLYWHPKISTTSVISATDIPRYSIVQPTRPEIDSWRGLPSSNLRQRTRRRERRKTSTGRHGTPSKRTGSAADASVTRTLWTWRGSMAVVWPNGWKLQADGGLHSSGVRSDFSIIPFSPHSTLCVTHTAWVDSHDQRLWQHQDNCIGRR